MERPSIIVPRMSNCCYLLVVRGKIRGLGLLSGSLQQKQKEQKKTGPGVSAVLEMGFEKAKVTIVSTIRI